ncbi:integrase arm-type DNA-binding domain-containing protein, partial [Salmonella enterica]|uniref:integrase arm-type DNA-binding domain-containing protein n=1 Tax=Salmonella sp. NW1111 TaxID=2947549 RepID=UPI0039673F40
MAKIAKKLTDTEIKSTKPADKEINLFDGDGLILRIAPLAKGGKKNWYFRYAVPVTKKRTKVSLGTYPHRHCCKVSDEAAFCLIQRPYISKTLLT